MSFENKLRVELRDNNGQLLSYLNNIMTSVSWAWNRIGGCGECDLRLQTGFDSVLAGSFSEDSEVRIYIPDANGTSQLWYSGFVDKVTPTLGTVEYVDLYCLGYVNQLKRVIVKDKTYSGQELSAIARNIAEVYATGVTSVVSEPSNQQLLNGDFETWPITDLLTDGGMEIWDNPTVLHYWTGDGTISAAQETTIKKEGTYSAKLIGSGNSYIYQNLNATANRNKKLIMAAWVYSTDTKARVSIVDDGTAYYSNTHTGSGWEYLSVVHTIGGSCSALFVACVLNQGATTAYYDSAICYEMLPPTSWILSGSGATIAREEGTVKTGTYSAKVTRNGADCDIYQDIQSAGGHNLAYWKGRTVTFGCWVWASVNNRARLAFSDGISSTFSSYHTGDSTWQYLTLTVTISSSALHLYFAGYLDTGDTTAYFDKAFVTDDAVKKTPTEFFYYEDSNFTADSIYFNEPAFDCISKLSDIAGKTEWGVDENKRFFFKRRDDSIKNYFNYKQDFTSFQPVKDFDPIVTSVYIEGGDGYSQKFSVTNKISTREIIVSNSSISTQSVGYRYAKSMLKDKGMATRSYQGKQIGRSTRIESTVPIGACLLSEKIGLTLKYDVASQKYDSGLKYDGGNLALQIEKIKYELKDSGINATLSFGVIPPSISEDLSKINYEIDQVANIT